MHDETPPSPEPGNEPQAKPSNVPPPPPAPGGGAGPEAAPPPPPPPPAPGAGAGGYEKADLVKRFVAAVIDGIVAGVIGLVPFVGGLLGAAYMVVRDGLELEFMDGRSLGKKVMKLRPVRLDGQPMDVETSIRRNVPFAIGPVIMVVPVIGWIVGAAVGLVIGVVESILVLTDAEGRRFGDRIAGTMVIEADE